MWPESGEEPKPLRSGLTTGTCATACCIAAARNLLADKIETSIEVTLPKGKVVSLTLEDNQKLSGHSAKASTIKDAGDDPDVTHGALISAQVELIDTPDIRFVAGEGVGTVTKTGLVLEVGEAAINPVPRQMMTEHLERAAETYQYSGGFTVTVSVRNGEALAEKTMNGRLGILGGLSILGTTGIVRPYSCAAYIASIHQAVDVAKANGFKHVAASTGSTSEQAIAQHYGLDGTELIEMGDFVGALLKHLRKHPIERVTICGGFGKMTKLAEGHMDLNSRSSSINFNRLADFANDLGANRDLIDEIKSANTSMQVLALCQAQGLDLASVVCTEARTAAIKTLREAGELIALEVYATDRKGNFVGQALA